MIVETKNDLDFNKNFKSKIIDLKPSSEPKVSWVNHIKNRMTFDFFMNSIIFSALWPLFIIGIIIVAAAALTKVDGGMGGMALFGFVVLGTMIYGTFQIIIALMDYYKYTFVKWCVIYCTIFLTLMMICISCEILLD